MEEPTGESTGEPIEKQQENQQENHGPGSQKKAVSLISILTTMEKTEDLDVRGTTVFHTEDEEYMMVQRTPSGNGWRTLFILFHFHLQTNRVVPMNLDSENSSTNLMCVQIIDCETRTRVLVFP